MAKDVTPWPMPSPKGHHGWPSGMMSDKEFISKHLGLDYPPPHVMKAGLAYIAGETGDLKLSYSTPEEYIALQEAFNEGITLQKGGEDVNVELTEFSDKPWDGSASNYSSTEEYCKACLIDLNEGGAKTQSNCKLPIKEPGGAVNKGALRAAWAAVNGARGGLKDVPQEKLNSAKTALQRFMKEASIEVNAELTPEEWEVVDLEDTEVLEALMPHITLADTPSLSVGDKVKWSKGGTDYTGTIKRIVRDVAMVEVDGTTGPLKMRFVGLASLTKVEESVAASEEVSKLSQIAMQLKESLSALVGWQVKQEGNTVELTATPVVYQLPIELEPAEKVGKKLWRKRIAKVGASIKHHLAPEGILQFSRETVDRVVKSFKEGAFPYVYATLGHGTEAKQCSGTAVDMFVGNDGYLYADFELGSEAEKVLEENSGKMGSSISLRLDYTRKADGRHFGPAIQHVALVPTPYDPNTHGSWEAIEMADEAEVVDLTDADSGADPRKEGGPLSEDVTTEAVREEVENPRVVELEEKLARLEAARHKEKVDSWIDLEFIHTQHIDKPHVDALRTLVHALDSEVINLSEDGSVELADSPVGNALKTLMVPPKVVPQGERGHSVELEDDGEASALLESLRAVGGQRG